MAETWFSFFPEAEADPSFGLILYRERPSMDEERKWFTGVLQDIQNGDLVKAVAEVGGHVVGWCDVRRVAPKTPNDHRGSLGICIRKGFRGRGIGKALVAAAIESCRGKFESLELTVLTDNEHAIRLYSEFGFKTYGMRPSAIKRGGRYFDEHLMYLNL
jgi:ribosomal protein S18 acetylase RimI-like enzyme